MPPPATDGATPRRDEPFQVLLRWTNGLDDERAVTLWAALCAVESTATREATLLRWIHWAEVIVALDVKLGDLATAFDALLAEVELVASHAERVYLYPAADLRPLTRALQGWMRARAPMPGAVLGALRALGLAREALRAWADREPDDGFPPAPIREVLEVAPEGDERAGVSSQDLAAALASAAPGDRFPVASAAVRLRVEHGPAEEGAELVVAWLHATGVVELPPWVQAAVDFALLAGELQGVHYLALASLAAKAPAAWTRLVVYPDTVRDALRAARTLAALASHPAAARELSPSTADVAQETLLELLGHPRVGVWSRAARAIGRLAGHLPGLSHRLLEVMQGRGAPLLRLRATATLGTLTPSAGSELGHWRLRAFEALEGSGTLDAASAEGAMVAALAVALPDLALDEASGWQEIGARIAVRGGTEAILALLRALLEIRLRDPWTQEDVARIAQEARERAESVGGSGADAERAERVVALAARLGTPDESSPSGLVAELARTVAAQPDAGDIARRVRDTAAEMDVLVSSSERAIGSDNARVAARGSAVLEEVVDLVVDGDLSVIAARVTDAAANAAATDAAHALRARLLKMVWSGLRRPTPTAFAWRRWLLRTAGALARAARTERRPDELDPVFETLERVADDPTFGQAHLLRHLATALTDLAQPLSASLGSGAVVSVLVWFAVRGDLTSAHARLRRWVGEDVPTDSVDRLFALIEGADRPGRDVGREVAELGVLAGGDTCRLGVRLTALGAECVDLAQRRPEGHWSGLPRFDLKGIAELADALRRIRDDASYALTLAGGRTPSAPPGVASVRETLTDRAGRINRMLTATSLKFMDGPRRAEVVEHYLSEMNGLAEAIAEACGPMLGNGLRSLLAKALVAVRAQANAAAASAEGVRYIARLRVLGELSSAHEGGMTSTFLAEGGAPGKKVVVKLLRWERFRGTSAELARGMFEGEMERLAGVVHPNIVSIMDAGFVDEGAYLALEYIPGASLETLLRTLGRLDLKSLGPIVRDVAKALAWLHARKIIHRDIKPGNVIVQLEPQPAGRVDAKVWSASEVVRAVLIDFGVATEVTRAGSAEGVTGTPGYIAPEVARGLAMFGPPVDVYALGVLVFELLTGFNPFLEGDPELNTVLVRHGSLTVPWQKLPAEASKPDLVQLLADSTRLDPRLRPTMRDFLARWSRALGLGV